MARTLMLTGFLGSATVLLLIAALPAAWGRGPVGPRIAFQMQPQTDPWPMVGGDPSHSGTAPGPAPPYREAWSARDLSPLAGPVVAATAIVVVESERVAALDRETGRPVWETARDTGPAGPPVVTEGLVIYAEGRGDEAGISAVRLEDGDAAWSVKTDAPVVGGLAVLEGRVYAGTAGGQVLSLSVEDGGLAWEHKVTGRADSAPAVMAESVYVTSEDFETGVATLSALDRETGQERWQFTPSGPALGVSSVSLGGELAIAGMGDFRVYGFEGATGRERWHAQARAPFSARLVPAVATAGSDPAVVVGDRAGHLYRLEPGSGELLWTFRVPGTLLDSSPLIAGEAAVVGDDSGQASAIDLSSGLLVWKRALGTAPVGAAASDGERLYFAVQGRGGRVVALEHDPSGALLAEPSPTTLFLGRALLNFAIAAAALGLILVVLARLGRRSVADAGAPAERANTNDGEGS
jgi:outer membrane protein assembly factor BamB